MTHRFSAKAGGAEARIEVVPRLDGPSRAPAHPAVGAVTTSRDTPSGGARLWLRSACAGKCSVSRFEAAPVPAPEPERYQTAGHTDR